jgi:hypothetical protein
MEAGNISETSVNLYRLRGTTPQKMVVFKLAPWEPGISQQISLTRVSCSWLPVLRDKVTAWGKLEGWPDAQRGEERLLPKRLKGRPDTQRRAQRLLPKRLLCPLFLRRWTVPPTVTTRDVSLALQLSDALKDNMICLACNTARHADSQTVS